MELEQWKLLMEMRGKWKCQKQDQSQTCGQYNN